MKRARTPKRRLFVVVIAGRDSALGSEAIYQAEFEIPWIILQVLVPAWLWKTETT
jgi:hypothetical protein